MKKNLFEMGPDFKEGWTSDNKHTKKHDNNDDIRPPEKHRLHIAKEKRRGKTVTVVKPFFLSKTELRELLKRLKKRLGTGGTFKDDTLEFQGEVSQTLRQELETMGYRFKQ